MIYTALGDSISIDDYPALDTGGHPGLGAASLFHRNDDSQWPEFRGSDLRTAHPGIAFTNLTADGATTQDVLRDQLPRVRESADEGIVTITAGGNDMLMHLGSPHPPRHFAEELIDRITRIVRETTARLPNARILIGTVYDPSDGTNVLEGQRFDREAEWLARYNDAVRRLADGRRVLLADIHRHFLGHGLTGDPKDRWYWSGLIFEPGARGASEVRRLWLDCVGVGLDARRPTPNA
jgi:lysophospholipase L1-like esterase